MSGGWKRAPSGVGTWQSAHSICWPKPTARRQPPRHLGDPAIAVEVQRVREFEVARSRADARSSDTRCMRGCSPSQRISTDGWNSGWRRSKSDASPSRCRAAARRDRYGSRRRIAAASAPSPAGPHARCGSRRSGPASWPNSSATASWTPAKVPRFGARPRQPARIGMVVDGGVAGGAGGVADRDRRPGRGRPGNCWRARHGRATGCRSARRGRHDSPAHIRPCRAPANRRPRSARPGTWPSTTMASVQAIGRLPGITADRAKRRVSNLPRRPRCRRARRRWRCRPSPSPGAGRAAGTGRCRWCRRW